MSNLTELDTKLTDIFDGCVVRKDLVKEVKTNSNVPNYVLEYLLGQYCATNDEDEIRDGIERVKTILAKNFVHRNEAELIKSYIKEKGSYRIIDKVSVVLDEKKDCYRANFSNLGIKGIEVLSETIKKYPRLLVSGVWCLVDLEYQYTENKNQSPWTIDSLSPIQLSNFDLENFREKRKQFTTDEWIDILIQSIGFNPNELTKRKKLFQLIRLIPYCERNYNFIELGPKGTGKSHIYTEFSPHGTLISGSEITAAKLFVNNSGKHNIGLVGWWDNIAFDEFAGSEKSVKKALVDIMKGYMANKSFSRGVETLNAEASFSFIGNTKHNVPFMLKHSNLFEELPPSYHDSAFLDRIYFYLPGWEVDITRNELFTSGYGFIVDYYSEALRELRKEDFSNLYQDYFELSSISTRDRDGVKKTFSGLMKIIFPDKSATEEEIEELLKFAMEGRKRVKDQILRIDKTFDKVEFYYTNNNGEDIYVKTTEEIQYPHLYYIDDAMEVQAVQTELPQTENTENTELVEIKPQPLKEGSVDYEECQTGVTYEKLFAPYLKGATKITIEDSYIQNPHQLLNLMDLFEVIESQKDETDIVTVDLITKEDEFAGSRQYETLENFKKSCMQLGIDFGYKFDNTIHDRCLKTDTGWEIILGRGLDIYQSFGKYDAFNFVARNQKYRPCKKFKITYVKTNK